MRRVSFTLFATVALLMMSALPLPVAAVGEVQASLSCSDGTTTDLVVDSETLTGLQDAVEAMTLYPAGLGCTLSTAPLPIPLGAGVAKAAGGTDFVVGGGQRAIFCNTNIAINGHRQSGLTTPAWGVVNQTIPEDAPAGCVGIMRTSVVCVAIASDIAIVGAYINTSTGLFSDAGYTSGTYLDWYFREGRANTTNPPLYGNSAPLAATTCTSAPTFNDTLEHGRILVKEHA